MGQREEAIRKTLRDWVKANSKTENPLFNDRTMFIEEQLISSIEVLDLILLIEELSAKTINATELKPGDLQNIESIYSNFFLE